jgi:hypothetical protein
MPRQSTVKRLPPQIRDRIGQLLDQGRTLDEIMQHLAQLDVQISRSALGRYKQHLDKVSERIRRSRDMAEALVRNLGEAPESKTARLNMELLHSVILDMLSQLPDAETEDGEGQGPLLTLEPMGAMLMAKSLDHLARAKKADADLVGKLREEARKYAEAKLNESVSAVEQEAQREHLTPAQVLERVKAIYRGEA